MKEAGHVDHGVQDDVSLEGPRGVGSAPECVAFEAQTVSKKNYSILKIFSFSWNKLDNFQRNFFLQYNGPTYFR